MTISDVISCIGVVISFFGSYYAAKGLLSLNVEDILKCHPTYAGVTHSSEDIKNIIQARIDARIGIFYVLVSGIVQMTTITKNIWPEILITEIVLDRIVIFGLIIFLILHVISRKHINRMVINVNKTYLRNEINAIPERINGVSLDTINFIIERSKDYFNLRPKKGQTLQEFLNDVSEFVGAKRLY